MLKTVGREGRLIPIPFLEIERRVELFPERGLGQGRAFTRLFPGGYFERSTTTMTKTKYILRYTYAKSARM